MHASAAGAGGDFTGRSRHRPGRSVHRKDDGDLFRLFTHHSRFDADNLVTITPVAGVPATLCRKHR
jgi:hypothetical protein